jgi:Kdo2-lipid IVA lauroyltransferase/acyltransferase
MARPIKPRHYIEAAGIATLMFTFYIMPVDMASRLGGWLARKIGPHTGLHRVARRQIIEFLSDEDADQIVNDMWDNLGRTIAEYPHLEYIARHRITTTNNSGADIATLKNDPALFIGGHFANWEVTPLAMLKDGDITPDVIYRAPNNPLVGRMLNRFRGMRGRITTHSKSRDGMRGVLAALAHRRQVGILIDQKYNEGVALPFFGKPAMTSTAFAALAQRFKCPIYPVQITRDNGVHFNVIIHPPMDTTGTLNDMTTMANKMIEDWMLAYPAQWLWVHQRWPAGRVQNNIL